MKKILFNCTFFCFCFSLYATDYYIKNGGSDNASGTSDATAWATLGKLNSVTLNPGDRIFLKRSSIWYEALPINQSGNSGNTIKYAAYGTGTNPTISGFTIIPSWTLSGGLYQYLLNLPGTNRNLGGGMKCNVVMVNNQWKPMGRYPKITSSNYGYLTYTSGTTSQLTSSALASAPNVTGGEIVIRESMYNLDRGTVSSQTSNTVNYSFLGSAPGFVTAGYGFFFQNHPNICTLQDEWCYDGGYVKIKSSSAPTTGSVKASTIPTLVNLTNRSYVEFVGIDFEGANELGFLCNNTSRISVDSCGLRYMGQSAVMVDGTSSFISVTNSIIDYINNTGIEGGQYHASLSTNWTVTGNRITNIGWLPGIGRNGDNKNYCGINKLGTGSIIQYNYVSNIGYIGIRIDGSATVSHNFIENFCETVSDGGGIYHIYATGTKTITHNTVINGLSKNVAYGTTSYPQTNGIYMDDDSRDGDISYNVVGNVAFRGIYIHNSDNFTVTNNTLYNCNFSTLGVVSGDGLGSVNTTTLSVTRNINFQPQQDAAYPILRELSQYWFGGKVIPTSVTWDYNWYAQIFLRAYDAPILTYDNLGYNHRTPASLKLVYPTRGQNDGLFPNFITTTNDSLFVNKTNTTITLNTGRQWKDIYGNLSNGSVTLAAYQAKLLFDVGTASGVPVNQTPVANSGPDQTITLPVNSLTITGSGTDPDGTITTYQWKNISSPGSFSISSPSQAQTVISNLVQGTYQFELTVTDNNGATDSDTMTVSVNASPVNQPPTADAGANKSITLPANNVTVSGSGSDPDGTIVSYNWNKVAGPAQYVIVSPSQAQTVINNLVEGSYQFELTVTDNNGATAKATTSITVNAAPPGQPPTANAGGNKTISLPLNSITLTGSGTDPDGTISTYLWKSVSSPGTFNIETPSQAQTVISNLIQGIYRFSLTVTDNGGMKGSDTMTLTVNPAPANQPPTANAGSNKTIILPANSVTQTGTGSDPDGTIVSYNWNKIAGPSQYAIVSPNQAETVINNLVQGTYLFELTVTDNDGAVAKATTTLTVNAAPSNQPPTAYAGGNIVINLPVTTVTLIGSGSDPDGTITSYLWTKISGPGTFSILSPDQAQTVINNLVQGIYQFELTVTDNNGATDKAVMTLTVNAPSSNQLPTANAGGNKSITLPLNSIMIIGSGTDPDGSITSYYWNKIAGPNNYSIVSPNQAQTVINNLVEGSYQFELTVTDNSGGTAYSTMILTVKPAPLNQPPTADAGGNKSITLPYNSVTITGFGTDPDGTITSYYWNKIAGPNNYSIVSPNQAQTIINNLVEGSYQFELTVTDDKGATANASMTLTVNPAPPNQPPTANAGGNKSITLPENSITITGSGTDPDGTITSYYWAKIAGPSSYSIVSPGQAQTVINNLVQGTYQFELTVTDNKGGTAKASMTLTVNPAPPNQSPVANAGSNITITLPTDSVILTGSGIDPDGTIITYSWKKNSGPSQYVIVSPDNAVTKITNLVQGTYHFELTVTDNNGATDKSTMTLKVNSAPANQPPNANAGGNKSINLPNNKVTLTGSGTDSDGTIVSYSWTRISGPDNYSIVTPDQSETIINNLVKGTYQFELTVTDNMGGTASSRMTLTVNPIPNNVPPTANAGIDQTITLPTNSVSVAGGGFDSDGSITSYRWTKISGPSAYNIISPNEAQTVIKNLSKGIYQFELTVTDNQGLNGLDTIKVIVEDNQSIASTARIYPNPSNSIVNIRIDAITNSNNGSLQIINTSGFVVYQKEIIRNQQIVVIPVDVSSLINGIYFIKIDLDINNSITLKFIKN